MSAYTEFLVSKRVCAFSRKLRVAKRSVMEYRLAREVEQFVQDIISDHHPHLLGLRVEFLFIDKKPKSQGRELWGRAKKISGLPAFLAGEPGDLYEFVEDFFVIEIAEEAWVVLSDAGKRALVDHSLSHCEIEIDEETGASKLVIVGPNVTEFDAVLRRHGAWNNDLANFVETAEQLSLTESAEFHQFQVK